MKRRVNVTLNEGEIVILESLRDEGLHGRTVAEVVRRLLDRQLENYCEKTLFDLSK